MTKQKHSPVIRRAVSISCVLMDLLGDGLFNEQKHISAADSFLPVNSPNTSRKAAEWLISAFTAETFSASFE